MLCLAFLVVVAVFQGCFCIPLPGVSIPDDQDAITPNENTHLRPYQTNFRRLETRPVFKSDSLTHGLPNTQDKLGYAAIKMSKGLSSESTVSGKTDNSLEKLLDILYGNSDWRQAADLLTNNPDTLDRQSIDSIPSKPKTDETAVKPQGFYANKISISNKDHAQRIHTTETPLWQALANSLLDNGIKHDTSGNHALNVPGINQINANGGNKQGVAPSTASPVESRYSILDTNNKKNTDNQQKHTVLDADSQQKQSGLNTYNQQKPSVSNGHSQPILARNGTKSSLTNVNDKSPLPPDNWASSLMRENTNFNTGMFDPNEVNRVQNSFNPGKSFDFITQTGSSPENTNDRMSFNADVVNEKYMQASSHGTPPGVSGTDFATAPGGKVANPFGAYTGMQARVFDANALNMRLLEGQGKISENAPPGVKSEIHTHQDKPGDQAKSPDSHESNLMRNPNGPSSNMEHISKSANISSVPLKEEPLQKPAASEFSFIPGNLYPGQRSETNANNMDAGTNFRTPPFLQSQRSHSVSNSFDPNALNAALTAFNPNSASWIHKRSSSPMPSESADSPSHNVTITEETTVKTQSTSAPIRTTTKTLASSSEPSTPHESSGSKGFDPNAINTSQGSYFVPGQLMPGNSDYTSNTIGHSQASSTRVTSSQNPYVYNPNQAPAISMNYDFQSLMGLTKTNQSEKTGYKFGFNPNAMNSAIANSYNRDGQSNASASGPGKTSNFFMSNSFNPDAVNVGFGNVLGNVGKNGSVSAGFGFSFGNTGMNSSQASRGSNNFGFGGGGFDPNAANKDFGAMSYDNSGFGGANASPYKNGFDANTANKAFMQTSYSNTGNDTNSKGGASAFLSGTYSSSFIASFNPDSVNKVSFDPSKFNKLHLHFDPVEMLEKNQGMNKATLTSAKFDPDKINSVNANLAFSPVKMLLGSGMNIVSGIKYAPSNGVSEVQTTATTITANSANNVKQALQYVSNSASFDPLALLKKQMQAMAQFIPGTSGINGMANYNPNLPEVAASSPKMKTSSSKPPSVSGTGSPATTTPLTTSSSFVPTTAQASLDKLSTASASKRPTTPGPLTTAMTTDSTVLTTSVDFKTSTHPSTASG